MNFSVFRVALNTALALLLSMFLHTSVQAFTLFPVRLSIDASHNVATLSVSNPTDQDITVQPRVFKWTQESSANGVPVDKLTDSTAFTIFPPVVTLKPQSKQTIRIRFNGSISGLEEEAFRVITEELLVKPVPGIVNFANAISIPMFVRAKVDLNPELIWDVKRTAKDALQLDVDNSVGNRHIQITGLSIIKLGADALEASSASQQSLFVYLLPKSRGSLSLGKLNLPAGKYTVKLTTDYKDLEQAVELK